MKPAPDTDLPLRSVLQRTLAVVLSATVLLLTLLTVSPTAHEDLHAHVHTHADVDSADHVCAVTLFAQGVTSPLCQVDVPRPIERQVLVSSFVALDLWLIAPDYLLRPLRGPPVS